MECLIISGMSGAGKSMTVDVLEDSGYYCIDNVPSPLASRFIELVLSTSAKYKKVALAGKTYAILCEYCLPKGLVVRCYCSKCCLARYKHNYIWQWYIALIVASVVATIRELASLILDLGCKGLHYSLLTLCLKVVEV